MQLDPRTLLAITAFILMLNAGIAVGIWWPRRTYLWLARWTAGNVLFGLGFFLLALRGFAPEWMSIFLANTALIIACYAYGAGRVASELIAHGADVRATNHSGANAVMAAAVSCTKLAVASKGAAWAAPSISRTVAVGIAAASARTREAMLPGLREP